MVGLVAEFHSSSSGLKHQFQFLHSTDKLPPTFGTRNKLVLLDSGAMIGTAVVFWPAAPLFLMMHGKDITIPQGHEVTVYTNSDYKPMLASATPAASNSMVATGAALTNADIVKLKEAGLGEQVLLAKIKSTPGHYQIDTEDLRKLKKAGGSDPVIAAMMEAKH